MNFLKNKPGLTLLIANIALLVIGLIFMKPILESIILIGSETYYIPGSITHAQDMLALLFSIVLPVVANLWLMIALFKKPHVIIRIILGILLGVALFFLQVIVGGIMFGTFSGTI